MTLPNPQCAANTRTMLAAISAIAADQREYALRLGGVDGRLTSMQARLTALEDEVIDFRHETRVSFDSVEERLVEIKDLIIGRNNGR
ncbi:hypothetical protein [Mycobacterium syngnathidarum]